MIAEAEEELICDFAETYHIYDYQGLPAYYAATLVCGLRDGSRVRMKLSGQKMPTDTLLLASVADALAMLVWFKTEDGQKNRKRPESILSKFLQNEKKDTKDKPKAFKTVAELDAAMAKFTRRN